MTLKDIIIKGDAWEMEQGMGMRGDQIVDYYASQPYITLSDPKTDEYAEFDYDEMNDDYESYPDTSRVKTGSRLDKFIKDKNRISIHPSNKKEIEEMGFELEV